MLKEVNQMNKLFEKFITYFYGSGIGLIIGVITTIVSTRLLSPADFGKASMFTLAVNITVIFVIFGTDQAFIRFFYEEAKELRNKLLLKILVIPSILLIITLLLLFLFKNHLMNFLINENNILIFFILISSIVFNVLYRFAVLVIRMQQKGHLYSLMEILQKFFNLIFLLIFYILIGPTYEILIYSVGTTLIFVTVTAILLEKKFWMPIIKSKQNYRHTQKDIFRYSYPLVLTTLIVWLLQSFDKIALRQWSTFDELGLYSAAFRIVALLTVVQSAFSTFWAPVCYEHFESKPHDKDFFVKVTQYVSLMMFTIAIITIAFKDVIVLLLGSDYEEAAIIMPFLIFMPVMYTLSETTVNGINFYKQTKWHIFISVIVCVLNIMGNAVLVPIHGAVGAAISTGLSYIVFFILRTHISIVFYNVNYRLRKIYIMITLLTAYAFQSTLAPDFYFKTYIPILLLFALNLIYKTEIKKLITIFFRNIKK